MPAPASHDIYLGNRLDRRQRWLLLVSLMLAMFMSALDQTIMATASPKIVADLGNFDLLSWMFTSYMLSSTVIVPLVGKLSDIYGRKPFLLGGVVIFLISSIGCGAAPSMVALIAFRLIQGIGGGMLIASVFTVLGDMFSPAERGKYTGLFTGTFSLASILGPTIGGLLTDSIGWRWVFYINLPVGAVVLPAIWWNLPVVRSSRRPRIDYLGAVWLTVASVALLLGLAWSGEELGWSSPVTLGLFALGAAATAMFAWQELHHPEPILPFHLFRIREFTLGNILVLCLGIAMIGTIPYLPTFVQTAMQASATASGLVTTPQSFGVFITSIVGGQIIARTGRYRALTVTGAVILLASMSLMLTLGPSSPEWHVGLFMVLLGLGIGMAMPTMAVVIPNAVPHEHLGVANSARQFFMQFGGVVGAAVFGLLLTTSFEAELRDGLRPETRAALSANALDSFSDPTLVLDQRAYAEVRAELLARPGGDAVLADAEATQRDAITKAIHLMFGAAMAVAAGAVLAALLFRELPLRRGAPAVAPVDHRPAPVVDLH